MSIEVVQDLRARMLPMFRFVQTEYKDRVTRGYPNIVDTADRGVIGLELDAGHSLYIVTDGAQTFADFLYRSPRNDARSSASREKFGGSPVGDRRPLSPSISDQALRNLVAELLSRWQYQPQVIHISDTD